MSSEVETHMHLESISHSGSGPSSNHFLKKASFWHYYDVVLLISISCFKIKVLWTCAQSMRSSHGDSDQCFINIWLTESQSCLQVCDRGTAELGMEKSPRTRHDSRWLCSAAHSQWFTVTKEISCQTHHLIRFISISLFNIIKI